MTFFSQLESARGTRSIRGIIGCPIANGAAVSSFHRPYETRSLINDGEQSWRSHMVYLRSLHSNRNTQSYIGGEP